MEQEAEPKVANVVEKFRKFWDELSLLERGRLWWLLTALRGPDVGSKLKDLTTARMRSFVVGEGIEGARVRHSPLNKAGVKTRDELLKYSPLHFSQHFDAAKKILEGLGMWVD